MFCFLKKRQKKDVLVSPFALFYKRIFPLLCSILFFSPMVHANFEDNLQKKQTPLLNNFTKTLKRKPDPVLMEGKWLPEFLGTTIKNLRLYRLGDEEFIPIRFQVDEKTADGDWILPYGKKNNRLESNGQLDGQDIILFMAKDAGDRARETDQLPEALKVIEIMLQDPEDQGQGWVYLALFGDKPPPLCPLPDYVIYDTENEILSSRCTRAQYLVIDDDLHTSFYIHHSIPPSAGGSGLNLVDRLKFRVEIRFLFNLIPIELNEEMLGSDLIAYIKGPIRVFRRYEQFVKLPFGLRAVKSLVDIELYESLSMVPIDIQIPKGINRVVSSATIQYGTDYSPTAIGSFFKNNENEHVMTVDGTISDAEKNFISTQDRWRIFYGTHGTLMTRTIFPPEMLEWAEIRQGYKDDLESPNPPERYPGSLGYAFTEIHSTNVRSGGYRFFLEFSFPPFYKPGDELAYLNIRDYPLEIHMNDEEYSNPVDLLKEDKSKLARR